MKFRSIVTTFFVLLLAQSCGPFKKDNEPQEPITSRREEIVQKINLYLNLEQQITDKYGFVDRGDGLLFSCLKLSVGGQVNWKAAEKESGRWERHPELVFVNPDPDHISDSSTLFSKDMENGLQWCFWISKDLAATQRHIEYLEDNDWDMCGGQDGARTYVDWISRCKLNANGKANLYEVGYRLGGDKNWIQNVPQIWNPWEESYPVHLTMLIILRRGLMQGAINDLQVDFLKAKSRDNPRNALYLAIYKTFTDGDMSEVENILMDQGLFPNDHLPTTKNYCTHYLFQRDQFNSDGSINDEWLPCSEGEEEKTWHGTDFMFAAAIATGKFK